MTTDDTVIRYVPTYVNKDGMRTLMRGAQGRFTFATQAEAATWMAQVTANNSAGSLQQAYGDNPQFEVRPCACWPGHFDPKGIYFD